MNNKNDKINLSYSGNRGAVAVIVAVVVIVLIGFGALAIDLGFAYVQRTKLQNAADAAALAGAEALYVQGQISRTSAANSARALAQKNYDLNNDEIEVQIGHWSFGMGNLEKDFYESNVLNPPTINLGQYNEVELDQMIEHINSVKVIVNGRSPKFFSRIWPGSDSLSISASAVAYLGFAGNLLEFDVDFPLVLCEDSIRDASGELTCGIGRLIHSGQASGQSDFNTGAWTNYSSGCNLNWSSQQMTTILSQMEEPTCTAPNSQSTIRLGEGISTGGGMSANDFRAIGDCTDFFRWPQNAGEREEPWNITVLVVDCEGANNPSGCLEVVGAVNITVVLITGNFPSSEQQVDRIYAYVPDEMSATEGVPPFEMTDGTTGVDRWIEFATHYGLQIYDPQYEEFVDAAHEEYFHEMTIYALPTCTEVHPTGQTGGPNFGVLARSAVLVR